MQVKVSVIIPVYNTAPYLKECLDSLMNQTLKEIEIICIDDGSTDDSLDILREYEKYDKRMKVIQQNNSGVSVARNQGIEHASGEFIHFMDSDDYISSDTYEFLYNKLQEREFDIIVFGGESFPTNEWCDNNLSTRNTTYYNESFHCLFNESGTRPFSCNKLYRTSIIKDNNILFNEKLPLGEDVAFLYLVFPLADTIVFTSEKFYFYRQNTEFSAMKYFNENIDLKSEKHLLLIETCIKQWETLGYLSDREHLLANWYIRLIYNDIANLSYNQKEITLRKTLSFLDEDLFREKLSKQNLSYLDKMKKICNLFHKPPEISVIFPVFNVENYIKQCLESIVYQTFINIQIICVNDGSTDGSLDIIKYFQSRDKRITLVNQENQGAGEARNNGLNYAIGDYTIFLDPDDFFELNMLENSLNEVKKFDAEICIFGSKLYDNETKKITNSPWTCKTRICPPEQVFSAKTNPKDIFYVTTPCPWNKLYKTSFIKESNLKFENTRSANDMVFIFLSLAIASKIVTLDECFVYYRVNNQGSLQGSQDKNIYCFYEALLTLESELKKRNIFEELQQSFLNFALDFCFYNLMTIKDHKKFKELFNFIKSDAISHFGFNNYPDEYYTQFKANQIVEKLHDIQRISLSEFNKKYTKEVNVVNIESKDNIDKKFKVLHRKLRGGIRCYKENGLRYTLQRIKIKLRGKLRKK